MLDDTSEPQPKSMSLPCKAICNVGGAWDVLINNQFTGEFIVEHMHSINGAAGSKEAEGN